VPAWCNPKPRFAQNAVLLTKGWGFKSLRGHHGPVVHWLGCRSFKAENAGRNRAGLVNEGISTSG
jgi:hypothetical protein